MPDKRINLVLILLGILNPVMYFINPYIFLVVVILEMLLVFFNTKVFNDKIWCIYLLSSMYFGVDIIGFKIYDLVIVLFIPLLIFSKKQKLSIKKYNHIMIILVYFIYISVLLLTSDSKSTQLAEYMRYIIGFITIIIFYLTITDLDKFRNIINFIPILAIKNLFSGIMVWILFKYFNMSNTFNSVLLNVNIYYNMDEFRLTGFFSDPNKYFTFYIYLLIISEFFNSEYMEGNKKILNKNNIILILGIILSFSRTGIFTLVAYLILKYIKVKFFYNDEKGFNIIFLFICIFASLCFILFKNEVVKFIDECIYNITIIMGREESLVYSGNLSNDSRVISWNVAIDSVKKSMFTGLGLFSWNNIYYMPPHNTFITIIQDTGLIGLFIFSIFILYGIKKLPIYMSSTLLLFPMMTLDLQNYRLLYKYFM